VSEQNGVERADFRGLVTGRVDETPGERAAGV
jgi:hypothetical protein